MDLSKGVVLDGYPASKIQGDYLTRLRGEFALTRVVVIHLSAPDAVVRKRLQGQSRDIEQELKDYHREFDFLRGSEPYKFRWATGERRTVRVRAVGAGLRPWLKASARESGAQVKAE